MTSAFGGQHSIQLSYGRVALLLYRDAARDSRAAGQRIILLGYVIVNRPALTPAAPFRNIARLWSRPQ